VSDFAGAIRVKNSLRRININEDQAVSLLEELSESCFKKGMSIQETAQLLADVKTKSEMVGIPIENLSAFVDKKREELQSHNETLKMFRDKIDQVLEEYVITMNDLEDYRKKRPLHQETIRSLQEGLGIANGSIDLLWKEGWDWMMKCTRLEYELSISTAEAIELNREMESRGQKELRPEELTRLVLDMLHHPTNYIDIIIKIRNQVQRYTFYASDYFSDDSDQVLTYIPEVELGEE
jgi:DNA-binding transcriptional MerR regulator